MSGKTVKLTAANFEHLTSRTDDVPVLVDFWAPWCGPCKMIGPTLEQLAGEFGDQAVIGKVNVDEEPELANAARIQAIPTLVLMRKGKVEDVVVGVPTKQRLKELLQ